MKASGPAANGAIALAPVWAGALALLAFAFILTLGPMFGVSPRHRSRKGRVER